MKGAEPPADDVGVAVHCAATVRRTRWLGAALLFAVVFTARPPRAHAEILVALDYQADAALLNCPSAVEFRQDIVRQIGRDPFRESAPRRVLVRLYTVGGRMAGRVEWHDANDQWEGERAFSSRNESCAQMARSMALATAIQIQLLDNLDPIAPAKPVAARAPTVTPPPPAALAPPSEAKPAVTVPPPPPVIAAEPAPPTAPTDLHIDVTLGVGVTRDLSDSPAFVSPRLAVTLSRASRFGLRLAAVGLGPGAEVSRPEGSAQLDRLLLTLEVLRIFRVGRRVQPMVAAGVGWQDLRVKGTSTMPSLAPAHDGHASAAVFVAGGGAAFALTERLSAIVEVETLLYRPVLNVQIASAQAARFGGVAVFTHGGLLARF